MMIQGVSVGDMLNQSMTVLTKPSVQSFEQFEKRGGQREALIYVVIAAVLVGVVGLAFGLLGGIAGAVVGLLRGVFALIGFYVFAFVMSYVGKQQGGTCEHSNERTHSIPPSYGFVPAAALFSIRCSADSEDAGQDLPCRSPNVC